MFDLETWLTSLLFTQPGGVQTGGASGEIGQHLSCHGVKIGIGSGGFQDGANVAEVGFIPGGGGEHHVA